MPFPIFTKAGATGSPLTLPKGRFLPAKDPWKPRQLRGIAGGGQVKIADLGTADHLFEIRINRVSSSDREAIIDFLQHVNVNYAQNSFTFTDEESVAHTVRYWNSSGLDFPRVPGNLYNIKLLLKVEITS
jgi:hypothetical protein